METIPIRQINKTQKEPVFPRSFTILNIENLLSGKDMIQALHRHDFFYILALERGKGEHIIDFTPYSIRDYAVFIMRPGQVHQLRLKKGSTGYLMEFNTDFYPPPEKSANQVLRKLSNTSYCQFSSDRFKKIHSILTYIFQEYADKQERYKDIIKANLEILLIELDRQRQSQNPTCLPADRSQYIQARLEDFIALLESHILTNKQVSQYADMLHLTPYQLNAISKETLGKTCSALINEHIILEAKRQLLATSNQINQIAYHLGYEDNSYFIRFFKKHTGYTPDAFRLNFK